MWHQRASQLSMRPTTPDALPASIVFGQPPAFDLREGIAQTVRWFEERSTTLSTAPTTPVPARMSGIFVEGPLPIAKTGT